MEKFKESITLGYSVEEMQQALDAAADFTSAMSASMILKSIDLTDMPMQKKAIRYFLELCKKMKLEEAYHIRLFHLKISCDFWEYSYAELCIIMGTLQEMGVTEGMFDVDTIANTDELSTFHSFKLWLSDLLVNALPDSIGDIYGTSD